MADKNLVMTFLNEEGARTSITLPGVRDDVTQAEIAQAMDVVINSNIFTSTGGNLLTKHSAQITERSVTNMEVR